MFTDADKLSVFSFTWNGAKIFVDPLLTLRNLDIAAGGSLNDLLRKVNSPEIGIADPATARLAYAVCATFKLGHPFNSETGEGVQYGQWIPVLNEFTDWLDVKKKRGTDSQPISQDSRTSSAAMGPESSAPLGFVSPTSIGSRSI